MKLLVFTSAIGNEHGWARYSAGLLRALEKEGIACEVVRGWFPLFAALRSDVMHAFTELHAWRCYWLHVMTGKPYFVTAHGTFALTVPAYILKNARQVICVSSYTETRVKERGIQNTTVIPNGITAQFLAATFSSRKRAELIITVGAVKERKGQHIALEAFALVADEFPDLVYEIIGDQSGTEYVEKLQHRAIELGLGERVLFTPPISDKELIERYQTAKIFVMTSVSTKGKFEGFGQVYLEAAACGTPAVGAHDTGAVDAIKDWTTGLLVHHNDHQSTARALQRILSDATLWERMSKASIEWAKAHDWQIIVKQYTALYQSVI